MIPLRAATAVPPALLVAAALAAAAPGQTPSFPAQSELVTVDVVVLGADGSPVAGLTRGDFVVKEDGRPQALAAFEAVEAVVPALASPETIASSPSPSQARVATNVSGPPTRRVRCTAGSSCPARPGTRPVKRGRRWHSSRARRTATSGRVGSLRR